MRYTTDKTCECGSRHFRFTEFDADPATGHESMMINGKLHKTGAGPHNIKRMTLKCEECSRERTITK